MGACCGYPKCGARHSTTSTGPCALAACSEHRRSAPSVSTASSSPKMDCSAASSSSVSSPSTVAVVSRKEGNSRGSNVDSAASSDSESGTESSSALSKPKAARRWRAESPRRANLTSSCLPAARNCAGSSWSFRCRQHQSMQASSEPHAARHASRHPAGKPSSSICLRSDALPVSALELESLGVLGSLESASDMRCWVS